MSNIAALAERIAALDRGEGMLAKRYRPAREMLLARLAREGIGPAGSQEV